MAARVSALLSTDYKDIEKLEKFLQGKPVAEQEIGKQLLADTVSYAETSMCRRKFLLHYFGGNFAGGQLRLVRQLPYAQGKFRSERRPVLVLQAIKESKERHRARFICDLLTGNETSEIKNYKGDKLKAYGSGSEKEATTGWA
jgi:ATP-dependent DNA helicase RecQ